MAIDRLTKAQLALFQNRETLRRLPHVLGTGAGYRRRNGNVTSELSVVVYVDRKVSSESLQPVATVPTRVDGPDGIRVRTDVVEIGVPELFANPTRYRPVVGGSSIGTVNCPEVGTLGGFACHMPDDDWPQAVFLTCNHVVTWPGLPRDMPLDRTILQPGIGDGGQRDRDRIGLIKEIVPIATTANYNPRDNIAPINLLDAAICSINFPLGDTGQSYRAVTLLARAEPGTPRLADTIPAIFRTASPEEGIRLNRRAVSKYGRTTGS